MTGFVDVAQGLGEPRTMASFWVCVSKCLFVYFPCIVL